MDLILLMETLQEELEMLFRDYEYESKTGKKSPRIDQGWYVEKKHEDDFPYILISPVSEGDDADGGETEQNKLVLIFGAYSKTPDGWKDVMLMAHKVKKYLQEHSAIGKRFSLVNSAGIKIDYPDVQPYPQWFCTMNITFDAYHTEKVQDWEV